MLIDKVNTEHNNSAKKQTLTIPDPEVNKEGGGKHSCRSIHINVNQPQNENQKNTSSLNSIALCKRNLAPVTNPKTQTDCAKNIGTVEINQETANTNNADKLFNKRKIKETSDNTTLSEVNLIKRFKTSGEAAYTAYRELAERRITDDNFKFSEIIACLNILKGYLQEYSDKKETTDNEKMTFKLAIEDCDELIKKEVPYLEMMDFIPRALSTIDFHPYSRQIKPLLKNIKNLPKDKIVIQCMIRVNDEGEYIIKIDNVYTVTLKTENPIHSKLGLDKKTELFLTVYPDEWDIADVYKNFSSSLCKDSLSLREVCLNKSIILLPTTKAIGYRSFTYISRFPIWLCDVSKEPAIVDGSIHMPLFTYYHDFIHAGWSAEPSDPINKSVVPKSGWTKTEDNLFLKHKDFIENFYNDFYEHVDNLKDPVLKNVCTLALFQVLHEGGDPLTSFQLKDCDKKMINTRMDLMKKRIAERFYLKIPSDAGNHTEEAARILYEKIESARTQMNMPSPSA
nr:hypothetical protein [Endozoicomonas sp.]